MKTSSGNNRHRYLGSARSSRSFSKRSSALDEPKVIVEVLVSENAKATNVSEHESTHDPESAGERCASIMSDKVVTGGRKRRVENSSSSGCPDPLLESSQNFKKMRQDTDTVETSEHGITHCIESTQKKVVDHHLVSFPSDQVCEGALEDCVLVVDKVIKVSEVICEITETQSFVNKDKLTRHNSNEEPQHESNGIVTSDIAAQQKIQELELGDVGLVNHDPQLQGEDISEKNLQTV